MSLSVKFMDKEKKIELLQKSGLFDENQDKIQLFPLEGGVSSDIFLVSNGQKKLVLKEALEKLRVQMDWHADIKRNRLEHEFISFVATFDDKSVPKVLLFDDIEGFFVMEYLEGFHTWKSELLQGILSKEYAKSAGNILGGIHRNSWNNLSLLKQFDSTDQFVQLRIDPYLHTTGNKYPKFTDLFFNEGIRLMKNRKCLVHGDYSPKNLMVNTGRMVIIDSEVAWYGDPAFDIAFLLNHLFLKSIYNHKLAREYMDLAFTFMSSYTEALGESKLVDILPGLGRLLLMLMIARVDGKSPVEYLKNEDKREAIRKFVLSNLKEDFSLDPLPKITGRWLSTIENEEWGRNHENQ